MSLPGKGPYRDAPSSELEHDLAACDCNLCRAKRFAAREEWSARCKRRESIASAVLAVLAPHAAVFCSPDVGVPLQVEVDAVQVARCSVELADALIDALDQARAATEPVRPVHRTEVGYQAEPENWAD